MDRYDYCVLALVLFAVPVIRMSVDKFIGTDFDGCRVCLRVLERARHGSTSLNAPNLLTTNRDGLLETWH